MSEYALLPYPGAKSCSRFEMAPICVACAVLSLGPLLVLSFPPIWTQPEQVHLSYPGQCLLMCFNVQPLCSSHFLVIWAADLQRI